MRHSLDDSGGGPGLNPPAGTARFLAAPMASRAVGAWSAAAKATYRMFWNPRTAHSGQGRRVGVLGRRRMLTGAPPVARPRCDVMPTAAGRHHGPPVQLSVSAEELTAWRRRREPEPGGDSVDLRRQVPRGAHGLLESGDVGAFGDRDLPPRVGGCLIDEGAQFLPFALMPRRGGQRVQPGGRRACTSVPGEIPADRRKIGRPRMQGVEARQGKGVGAVPCDCLAADRVGLGDERRVCRALATCACGDRERDCRQSPVPFG